MLIFPMKKEWYETIKRGEKTVEYREMKPYWTMRIFNECKRELVNRFPEAKEQIKTLSVKEWLAIAEIDPVVFEPADGAILQECCRKPPVEPFTVKGVFSLGYGTETVSAIITKIEIVDGKNTDLHIDKLVYAIHFYLQNNNS